RTRCRAPAGGRGPAPSPPGSSCRRRGPVAGQQVVSGQVLERVEPLAESAHLSNRQLAAAEVEGRDRLDEAEIAGRPRARAREMAGEEPIRSEEHTSELQSRFDLVCRLLLEKKK